MTRTTHPTRSRRIELASPLEVFDLSTMMLPFPHTYRVRAVTIHASGVLDAEAFDFLGNRIAQGAVTRKLACEAVRVLGIDEQLGRAPRSKPRRRPGLSSMIPEVWGLNLRAVG